MEELHRIHKDVPFGYWVLWLEPAYRTLARKWRERGAPPTLPTGRLSAGR